MGYASIDHRATGGRLDEFDTEHCRHCEALIRRVDRHTREGAWCSRCGGPVCNTPACATTCTPFLRRIEQQLQRDELARAAGLVER